VNVLGVPFEVKEVAYLPDRYQLPVVTWQRPDGVAGWLRIEGPMADEMKVGKTYKIVECEPTNGG
jgi:hypothetical protein